MELEAVFFLLAALPVGNSRFQRLGCPGSISLS